ncbi:unnamed protein product [Linum trigynum]|uniref:Ribosomal protein L20 n=1 Tax=Linum trigynum TaxID=586398 RepID=A0AAV2D0K0_9ROSI
MKSLSKKFVSCTSVLNMIYKVRIKSKTLLMHANDDVIGQYRKKSRKCSKSIKFKDQKSLHLKRAKIEGYKQIFVLLESMKLCEISHNVLQWVSRKDLSLFKRSYTPLW